MTARGARSCVGPRVADLVTDGGGGPTADPKPLTDRTVHLGAGEISGAILVLADRTVAVRLRLRSELGDTAAVVLQARQLAAVAAMLEDCRRARAEAEWERT